MMQEDELLNLLKKRAESKDDGLSAIAYAILRLAETQSDLAGAVQRLGNGNASTHFGAIEGLGMAVAEAMARLSDNVSLIADAVDRQGERSIDE